MATPGRMDGQTVQQRRPPLRFGGPERPHQLIARVPIAGGCTVDQIPVHGRSP